MTKSSGPDGDGTRVILAVGFAALCLVVTYKVGQLDASHPATPITRKVSTESFAPPDETAILDGPDGDAIRRGKLIFIDTATHAGDFVGNGLKCSNCHLDAGRKPDAAPMWAAWVRYPAYRAKNGRINTMEDRILECFLYSMNAPASKAGSPPPRGDAIYRDLQSYFAWLATDAPWGKSLPGRGFKKLEKTSLGFDPARGVAVYAEHCAACHGTNGQGQGNPDGSYAVPPLWGAKAYNWGAGMTRISNASGFIKSNMPLGQEGSLTDQQAWDVAAYIDSRERPRDPRQTGTVEEAKRDFHSDDDYYGQTIDGVVRSGMVASQR